MKKPPRILNEAAINALRCEPRYLDNFWVRSFILTLDALREKQKISLEEREDEIQSEIDRLTFELTQERNKVRWFEETYNTRAFAPLRQRRRLAERCPHCGAREATKIGTNWTCFECQKLWEQDDRNSQSS